MKLSQNESIKLKEQNEELKRKFKQELEFIRVVEDLEMNYADIRSSMVINTSSYIKH